MKLRLITAASLSLFVSVCAAQTITINMYKTSKISDGAKIGTVTVTDTQYGLLIKPKLHNLTPGLHGFHVHQYANCLNMGMAAGGHLDPAKTGKHLGPYNKNGHLGDLPVLYVNKAGDANRPELAPRLKVSDLKSHSLMIHAGGDNYSDSPQKLGGGGARIACGVIRK